TSHSASGPASRTSPAACAASTYRRAVFLSTPTRSAIRRNPPPSSHPRRTSRISTTSTSRNATGPPRLTTEREDRTSAPTLPASRHAGGPMTGKRWSQPCQKTGSGVVPSRWQATRVDVPGEPVVGGALAGQGPVDDLPDPWISGDRGDF